LGLSAGAVGRYLEGKLTATNANAATAQRRHNIPAKAVAISLSPLFWPALVIFLQVTIGGYLNVQGHSEKFVGAILPLYVLLSYLSSVPIGAASVVLSRKLNASKMRISLSAVNTGAYSVLIGVLMACVSALNGSKIQDIAMALIFFSVIGSVLSLPMSISLYFADRYDSAHRKDRVTD
jgi:hypothetical protein